MDSNTPQPRQSIMQSPFDPFLARFLAVVREFERGYSPQSNAGAIAQRLDVDPAFIETLTISARRRSLIEPFYASAHRNTVRWRVSGRGNQFLTSFDPPETLPD